MYDGAYCGLEFFSFCLFFSFLFAANFRDSVVENLPADICTGIYYGWACVGNGDVYKMVMSIGWNPYYKNTKKSMVSKSATESTANCFTFKKTKGKHAIAH